MAVRTKEQLLAADTKYAVEIADRIWWVGHHLPEDPFQCHAYLIEHGDQSVLIDPGSKLTFPETLKKIEQVTSFDNIKYFICHHQDTDLTGCINDIDDMVTRADAYIVCHWRSKAIIRHYAVKMPFWLVDRNDWRLDLNGRALEFVFTPYMHFPGAFCTYDRREGVLFSSDIFGGFTEDWSLVARDETYFEMIRPFHEHYMPSREVVLHGLARIEALQLELIAPQHGSIIPKSLIYYTIEKIKGLDCGLFLVSDEMTDIVRLSRVNQMLRRVLDAMVLYRDFREVALALLQLIQDLVPAQTIEFYAGWKGDDESLYFGPSSRYRGERVPKPALCKELFNANDEQINQRYHSVCIQRDLSSSAGSVPVLIFPLKRPDADNVSGLAIVTLSKRITLTRETAKTIEQITMPLEVALERERIFRVLEEERREIFERAIRDQLTGLYTRTYFQDAAKRMFEQHDRDPEASIAMIMLDVDLFKSINDTYGHLVGDNVLRQVAEVLRGQLRGFDIGVRLGGEEFGVLLTGRSAKFGFAVAARIREQVAMLSLEELGGNSVTVSAGVALRLQQEPLDSLLKRADDALYEAKRDGRNRVVTVEAGCIGD